VTAGEVSEFVLGSCGGRSVGSATILVVALRAFLRYLHLAGITPTGLAGVVPSAACWPAARLPRPISGGDAGRLLRSCDRRTAAGRRDFAVLTLLLRLGLRVSEVADLPWSCLDSELKRVLTRVVDLRVEHSASSLQQQPQLGLGVRRPDMSHDPPAPVNGLSDLHSGRAGGRADPPDPRHRPSLEHQLGLVSFQHAQLLG